MSYLSIKKALPVIAASVALSACGGIDDNEREIDELQERVDTVEARLTASEAENAALTTELSDTDAELATTMSELSALETRLAELEAENAELSSDNDAIEAELALISAQLDEIEERLGDVENVAASVYEITLVNVTANQPLAPAAVILHEDAYFSWEIGAPASSGIEMLAEGGSPATLLSESTFALDSVASDGILPPGATTTVRVQAVWQEDLALTIAAMPVNTNDAFSGTTAWNIASLEEGATRKALLPIYDAGTEANTETAATMPGPAAGGEGFNAARDDLADVVTRHPGVVTSDDGLASSALDQSHRFDQGAIYVTVTRLTNP